VVDSCLRPSVKICRTRLCQCSAITPYLRRVSPSPIPIRSDEARYCGPYGEISLCRKATRSSSNDHRKRAQKIEILDGYLINNEVLAIRDSFVQVLYSPALGIKV